MSQQRRECRDDDEFALAFPGCLLTHVLTIVTDDALAAAIGVLEAIQASGGQLQALSLAQSGEATEHRLRLTGLRPEQARSLTERVAALPRVASARVEHQLIAQRTQARTPASESGALAPGAALAGV